MSFPEIAALAHDSIELWNASSREFPSLGRQYTEDEQQERELLLDRTVDRIDAELRNAARARLPADEVLARITTLTVELATCSLDLKNGYIESLLREGFSRVGIDLARWARTLDSRVSLADILQACRNAWTACGLQLLLGVDMRLTPAIFAYSMLYPYTDNYLDDRKIAHDAKFRFSARFRSRLAGEEVLPTTSQERMVWELVGLIESEYARLGYPDVYESLLAIHRAQQESIHQMQNQSGVDLNLVTLTVTKGGTSVLADAYLARGTLTQAEARFAFKWGVLLQLSDDLQDVHNDRRRGSRTLFTQKAGREPLDGLTNQTFQFGQAVMARMSGLPNGNETLRELLARSLRSLLIRSVANAPKLFSAPYLTDLETYSPFRFAFLRSREQRFSRRSRSYARVFELLLQETVIHTGALESLSPGEGLSYP